MKNSELKIRKPLKILAFDKTHKLAAIFSSHNEAERMVGVTHQVLLRCCKGDTITAKTMYWREVPPDQILDIDDIGTLSLIEYDSVVGIDRRIYATSSQKKSEVILSSQYANRFQVLKSKRSNQWKKSKSK